APSTQMRSIRNVGSTSSNANSAASSPATTPGWRPAITASTVASSGTIASVVMSPARPRSSSNAARTIGSMISRIVIPRLRSAQGEHAFDGAARPLGDRGIDRDLVGYGFERAPDLRQGDALHVRAQIAGPHEIEIGILQRDIVAHRALGQQHDATRLLLADKSGHCRGQAGEIALCNDLGGTFRM